MSRPGPEVTATTIILGGPVGVTRTVAASLLPAPASRAQLEGVLHGVVELRHRVPGCVGLARPAVGDVRPGLPTPVRPVAVLVAREARIRRRRGPGENRLPVAGRGREAGRRLQRRLLRQDLHRQARGRPGEDVAHVLQGQHRLGADLQRSSSRSRSRGGDSHLNNINRMTHSYTTCMLQ